ncbi:hypothetical protein LU276_08000 [Moraxella haemolytica]|nr:hypothetical protein [Moraxella sp. ZY171148]WII96279.1 hypothetical protein LU276_08000 [Moraxella sp. ZY171148]
MEADAIISKDKDSNNPKLTTSIVCGDGRLSVDNLWKNADMVLKTTQ